MNLKTHMRKLNTVTKKHHRPDSCRVITFPLNASSCPIKPRAAAKMTKATEPCQSGAAEADTAACMKERRCG